MILKYLISNSNFTIVAYYIIIIFYFIKTIFIYILFLLTLIAFKIFFKLQFL